MMNMIEIGDIVFSKIRNHKLTMLLLITINEDEGNVHFYNNLFLDDF